VREASNAKLAVAVFFILLSVYLLTASRTLHADADEGIVFASIENVAKFARFDIEQIASVSKSDPWEFGVDGKHYSKYGLMQSILPVPLYMIATRLSNVGNADLVLLFNVFLTALTAAVVLLCARTLGYSVTTSVMTSFIFGLGTIAWPYSKRLLGEPGSSLLLLTSVYCLLRYERSPRSVYPLLAGAFLGMAFAYKASNGIVLLAETSFLVYVGKQYGHKAQSVAALMLPFVAFVAIVGVYNYVRFGSPSSTGYGPEEGFTTPLLHGLWGLFFSPGRSFFLYSPILLVSVLGFIPFARKHRGVAILLGLTVFLQVFLYAQWWNWWGGLSWGPRLLVPLAPLMTLWLLPLITWALREARWASIILAGMLTISFGVQVLAVATDRSVDGWRSSPLLSQPGYLGIATLDLTWVHNREPSAPAEVDYLSLALMLGLVFLTTRAGFSIAGGGWSVTRAAYPLLLGLLAFAAATVIYVVLARAHRHVAYDYKAMMSEVVGATSNANESASLARKAPDALIFSDFMRSDEFLNLNKSSTFVLGWGEESPLSSGLESRLEDVTQRARASSPGVNIMVHITPNRPRDPGNGIERFLKERLFVWDTTWFGNTRLVRYLAPGKDAQGSLVIHPPHEHLAGLVKLRSARIMAPGSAGEGPQGQLLFVTLEWESLAPMARSYTVFVQILGPDGKVVAQKDQMPIGDMMPTTSWVPGQIIVDNYVLLLEPGLQGEKYALVAGMYDLADGTRLPVVGSAGEELGDFLFLTTVEVGRAPATPTPASTVSAR